MANITGKMVELNKSNQLSMNEIVGKLLDNNFLSDITFKIGDKSIAAHSFLLMNRSVVFQENYQTNEGVAKLIPIENFDYDTFYAFLLYMYTDECAISKVNVIKLLELSLLYKVGKLESETIEFIKRDTNLSTHEYYRLFELGILYQHDQLRNQYQPEIAVSLLKIFNSNYFLNAPLAVITEILKLEYVGTEENMILEIDFFVALNKWMDAYCDRKNIKPARRRQFFEQLIRLIRFPVMPFDDLKRCIQISNNLFTNADHASFLKQEPDGLWTATCRRPYSRVMPWFGANLSYFYSLFMDIQ